MLSEFALIDRFFRDCGAKRGDVPLGVGDDAAILDVPPGKQLVAAIDTLVEGVHFPVDSPPASIGHRALAVNLSDLAAMGAEPAWALLALTLPNAQEAWLAEFAKGLGELACKHNVALVGGDTTSGPLTVSIQVLGFIEPTRALRRAGARPGDVIFVSGTPGDAAGGLQFELGRARAAGPKEPPTDRSLLASAEPSRPLAAGVSAEPARPGAAGARDDRAPPALISPSQLRAAALDAQSSSTRLVAARHAHEQTLRNRFLFPTPRVALGQRLLNFATACIDVSDGLLGDAGKLAQASRCSVELEYSKLPISVALVDAFGEQRARELALSGGDDYELCFAVPPSRVDEMLRTLPPDKWHYTLIGVLKEGAGASVIDKGTVMHFSHSGYDHFAPPR